jgi:sugar phosphate isomerase/epimerase
VADLPRAALGPHDLVLSHFSLGRFLPFEVRVKAAADAGFAAMGCYVGDYRRLRAGGISDADLRAILQAYGMRVAELEALRGWSGASDDAAIYRAAEDAVLRMNDALGPADTVQVVGPYEGTIEQAGAAFAGVCDRLAKHDLRAAIEFLPEMTNIPDAATALRIVTAADRSNGGLCIDSWHHFRGAHDDAMLRAIPPERVFTIQLNDGPVSRNEPDYYDDCTRHRLPPGRGQFDLRHFVNLLRDMGVQRPLSIEVLSHAALARDPQLVAHELAYCTRELLHEPGRIAVDGVTVH